MNKLSFFFSFALLAALASVQAAAQIAPPVPRPGAPTLAPGLYVQVIDGLINVSNKGGSSNFAAGQFGFTPSLNQPPIVVPKNPGIQFTPPSAFSPLPANTAGTASAPKSNAIECEVR